LLCVRAKEADWLQEDYFRSIRELAEIGAKEILRADDLEAIRAILSVICDCQRSSDAREVPRRVSDDELLEMESR
jgi:hypothetical protein